MSSVEPKRRTAHTSEGLNYQGEPRYHHGRSPAAWVGSLGATLAFVLAGVAVLLGPNWTLFIVAGVILLLSLIGARVLQVMGKGNID